MTRAAQNLLLILLGGAVLWITVGTDEYLNYVRPGFWILLVAAAVVMIGLGLAGLRRDWRADDHHHDDGHRHAHGGPRVAWLLCLPALAIFVIAPPALGSFTASRATSRPAAPPPPPDEGYGMLHETNGPVKMTIGEFIGRSFESQTGYKNGLPDIRVALTGFVTPRKKGGGWYLTRLKITCCAGDAIPFQAIIRGPAQPPPDTWLTVTGRWIRPPAGASATGVHELRALIVQRIKKPKKAYE